MTGNRCKLEILHQCGERVKTKSHKVLAAKSYVCRSYKGKTGKESLFAPSSWIGLKIRYFERGLSKSLQKVNFIFPLEIGLLSIKTGLISWIAA